MHHAGADLGGGCRGCAPPPPEMTCGFLIQLVFCKKNYVVYWCWSRARDECTPPKKNPGSALDHAFLYISLPSLHNYDVKMPNASFMGDVNKRRRISFFLSKLEGGPPEISSREMLLHLPFSANWNKRDKVWKKGIHFETDVFAAVAVVDAKAPYHWGYAATWRPPVVRHNERASLSKKTQPYLINLPSYSFINFIRMLRVKFAQILRIRYLTIKPWLRFWKGYKFACWKSVNITNIKYEDSFNLTVQNFFESFLQTAKRTITTKKTCTNCNGYPHTF